MNENEIELLVRQVLNNLNASAPSAQSASPAKAPAAVPKTGRTAFLTGEKKIEVKEYPIPALKDDEILVKVEGCGVCGTDVHEWRGDPFGLIPVVLGHEGSGEIIAMGKNVKTDTVGKPVNIGDKVVTSVMVCGKCDMCRLHPDKPNLCENSGVYGLLPDDEYKFNGWFGTHIILRGNSTFFNVSDMNLDQRLLIEPCAVAVHAVGRAQKTNILDFSSNIVVQGCGPIGLIVIAVLKTYGYRNIIAIDGNEQRLDVAKKMGAVYTVNFKNLDTLEKRVDYVKSVTGGLGADFAFQCTGVPVAASDIYKYVRKAGGVAEIGFFVNNGEAKINPHFDICSKEVTIIGSWTYDPLEYPVTIAFMRRAKEIGIPLEELITHRFSLDELNEAMETNVSLKGIKVAYVNKD